MFGITFFDHYSNQEHESARSFLEKWGTFPWDDANVPIYMSLNEGIADIIVYQPRKEHIKHLFITIKDEADMQLLRDSFKNIRNLYEQAILCLEDFANGVAPVREENLVLYYWNYWNHKEE